MSELFVIALCFPKVKYVKQSLSFLHKFVKIPIVSQTNILMTFMAMSKLFFNNMKFLINMVDGYAFIISLISVVKCILFKLPQ